MYNKRDLIDSRFEVLGTFEKTGGMGTLLYVRDTRNDSKTKLLLKYCHETDERFLKRFCREIRLLGEFQGNSRVVDVNAYSVKHDPPYFVMKYYKDGDLSSRAGKLGGKFELQEALFTQMIDCINELHAKGKLHRDIKPQNFLVDGSNLVVSDFGLGTELEAGTALTKSSEYWGTHGYLPPECYLKGGFKHADERCDIFMLGKTFYVLLSAREPAYLVPDEIPEPLFAVVERCCAQNTSSRYSSLAELRQSLVAAFDILLNRIHGPGLARQLLEHIQERLTKDRKYSSAEVKDFLEALEMQEPQFKIEICLEIGDAFFRIVRERPCLSHLSSFLKSYRLMAEEGTYAWSFAENIADNMGTLCEGDDVSDRDKAEAIEIALIGAIRQNRFAAMATCRAMIVAVTSEGLAVRVRDLLLKYKDASFLTSIEPSSCHSGTIAMAIEQIKKIEEEESDDIPF